MEEELLDHQPNISLTSNQTPNKTIPYTSHKLKLLEKVILSFHMPFNKEYNKKNLLTKASFSKAYRSCSHNQAKLAKKKKFLDFLWNFDLP